MVYIPTRDDSRSDTEPASRRDMTGKPERWIIIPNWDRFQHYPDRDPIWIKNYRDLLSRDEYRDLTWTQRGILHGLWLEYAASNRQLRDSTVSLTRRLGQRVTRASLEALNQAGFITFSASKPIATRQRDASPRARRETRLEEDKRSSRPLAGKTSNGHGALERISIMIRNGALTDLVDLTAEIAGAKLAEDAAQELRAKLEEKVTQETA